MNDAQRLWWRHARSDHELFIQLRHDGVHECHLLHYLQMTTEKLSKAYFWRSGHAPPKSHTGFVRFLKALLDRRATELNVVAASLGFPGREALDDWVLKVQNLAYSLQNIAPAEAGAGPNPEYPWPHESPSECPAGHGFALWDQLINTGQGRKLIVIIDRAVRQFEVYA